MGDGQVAAPSDAGVSAAAATQGAAAGSAQAVASAGSQVAHAAGQQAAGPWVRHRDANYYVCKHLQAGDYWWRSEQESCTGRKLREVRLAHSAASRRAPWLGLLTCFNGLPYAVCLDLCCCGWASAICFIFLCCIRLSALTLPVKVSLPGLQHCPLLICRACAQTFLVNVGP